MSNVSKGVYLETDRQGRPVRVTDTVPPQGVQLIAPGIVPSTADLEGVERARAACPREVETASLPAAPETASLEGAKPKQTRSRRRGA